MLNVFLGCSKCDKQFKRDGFGSKPDYSGYNEAHWTPREHDSHLEISKKHKKANTLQQQKEIEYNHGVRYSELSRLPYFNPIDCHLVDPMHCLLLGVAKHTLKTWIEV